MGDEMSKAPRGAVLQFEVDRDRYKQFPGTPGMERPMDRLFHLAHTAVWDTISHGGTFVLVASPTKITMVQRPDAEEI